MPRNEFFAVGITKDKGHVEEMEHNGFKASLMRAERLKNVGGAHGLPPGSPIPVYPMSALPGAPHDWVRGPGSYVCPVDPDWGLWFDWTMNDGLNTAVLPSVKGMNPITGRKLESLALEQYSDNCPVHNKPLGHGKMCEECGFKWPPQNYVCHPSVLWWDGFRTTDGKVRQFFFSAEDEKDIPSLVIGKNNVVPAFGFAFFRPKNPRQAMTSHTRGGWMSSPGISDGYDHLYKKYVQGGHGEVYTSGHIPMSATNDSSDYSDTVVFSCNACASAEPLAVEQELKDLSMEREEKTSGRIFKNSEQVRERGGRGKMSPTRAVSVGAGAEIRQDLRQDSLGLDGWQKEPSGIIRLYFCFEAQFHKIVKDGGIKEVQQVKEGYLKGLPVG